MNARDETRSHIGEVQRLLLRVIGELADRALRHDASKLESPEVEIFDEFTPRLREVTYGSAEYRSLLVAMGPALQHHYAHNRHHPEYHAEGIHGMHLVDLVEMLADWLAATRRHADGDIRRSIEVNAERFSYSCELKRLLLNTIPLLEDIA